MEEVDKLRDEILTCEKHLLVSGGPGAGKTTVALAKALKIIEDGRLLPGQKILFLSFARATVARIVEAARMQLNSRALANVEIDTYHGFAWRIIRSHSYLTNGRPTKLLLPADVGARLADIPENQHAAELKRLWEEDGHICFDLFAEEAQRVFLGCRRLASIYSAKFPAVIILDEFQDTNGDQWGMIQAVATDTTLIALADPEQRIYDFAGADPRRIGEFIAKYDPTCIDLAGRNHRSNGTDIAQYGNDLLTGANRGKRYTHVTVKVFGLGKAQASSEFALKAEAIGAIRRLSKNGTAWSLAILVPTQVVMVSAAKYFAGNTDGLKPGHLRVNVHVDQEWSMPCRSYNWCRFALRVAPHRRSSTAWSPNSAPTFGAARGGVLPVKLILDFRSASVICQIWAP